MGQDRSSVSCGDEGECEDWPDIFGRGKGAAVARLVRRIEALERRVEALEADTAALQEALKEAFRPTGVARAIAAGEALTAAKAARRERVSAAARLKK